MAKEKSKLTFRKLTADEIEVRVGSGNSLLLYKTARTDANILDETVGAENWQKKYTSVMTTMFCSLGININYDDPSKDPVWVWKEDAGDDDYTTEKVKAQASDCFKRAGFAWGIGRELYTSPRIKLDEANKSKSYFECERIGYDEDGHINNLRITTDFGKTVVYEMVNGKKLKQGETHNAPNRAKNTPNNAISNEDGQFQGLDPILVKECQTLNIDLKKVKAYYKKDTLTNADLFRAINQKKETMNK